MAPIKRIEKKNKKHRERIEIESRRAAVLGSSATERERHKGMREKTHTNTGKERDRVPQKSKKRREMKGVKEGREMREK